MKYSKKYLKKIAQWYKADSNEKYLARHTELVGFDFPKHFYFRYLPEQRQMHWAIIKPFEDKVKIYFINDWGRVFDELEYKKKKIAQRRLRRNGFDFSTNVYCPFTPPEPIYIKLSHGKKTAPYSKGNLWQSVKRDSKQKKKAQKIIFKRKVRHFERIIQWMYARTPDSNKIATNESSFKKRILKNFKDLITTIVICYILVAILVWLAG